MKFPFGNIFIIVGIILIFLQFIVHGTSNEILALAISFIVIGAGSKIEYAIHNIFNDDPKLQIDDCGQNFCRSLSIFSLK